MNTFLLFGQMFGMEAILIFFVILLLFGGKKIPELMRGFGKGVGEFNKARQNVTNEFKEGLKEAEKEKIKIEDKAS